MSYRLKESRRRETLSRVSSPNLPTHQLMSLIRGIAPSKRGSVRSTRSLKREAMRKATASRVKAEISIVKRKGLEGKHLTDKQRAKLFKDLKSVFAIAYSKNPELFSYAR